MIFQSTLLQEERHVIECIFKIVKRFQSTLLQEERQSHSSIPIPFILLSIHAPTRGATLHLQFMIKLADFQSTLLQEERQEKFMLMGVKLFFQSTLLQEERHNSRLFYFYTFFFQSTLLQEERREILKLTPDYFAFNPRSYKRSDIVIIY